MTLFGFFSVQPSSLTTTMYRYFSTECSFGFFLKNEVSIDLRVYICIFYFILLMNVSVLIPVPFCFYYYRFQYNLKSGMVIPLTGLLLFRVVLTTLSILCFHIKLKIVFLTSVKNCLVVIHIKKSIFLGFPDWLTCLLEPLSLCPLSLAMLNFHFLQF